MVDNKYDARFIALYLGFMTHLLSIIRPGTNIRLLYDKGSENDQEFVQRLALFFTSFFKVQDTASSSPPPPLFAL